MTAGSQSFLKGITILDLSSLLPSPFAAHLLAKQGARVIKIESRTRPDPARQFGYTPPGGVSACYRAINTNKELVWLDLKTESDRAKLYELVRTADAAIEGYRPEVRKRLGIEFETLKKHNPKFVLCSVGGYDPQGPMRDRAGHDMNFAARSGILDLTRDREGHCVLPGLPLGDCLVAYSAALRLACAIQGARATGLGSHLEITIEEALAEAQTPFSAEARESGVTPKAGETLVTGRYPCYRLYEVRGGTLALGAIEEKFWRLFCETIGRPALVPDQYTDGLGGNGVVSEIERALSVRDFREWCEIFSKVDCCVEPVLTVKEALDGV
jgi:crotonobetainyl-CoA:carnitine CoA-transferase CaiB-like acyl-CoA transferase